MTLLQYHNGSVIFVPYVMKNDWVECYNLFHSIAYK